MITCCIRYEIDPYKRAEFEQYARNWGVAIPRCGAQLIGYFAPHEGSATLAYGLYDIESLAAYETYRLHLAEDSLGKENYAFAQRERFILREERVFLKRIGDECIGIARCTSAERRHLAGWKPAVRQQLDRQGRR